jgi:iron complex outermembrane receptor protein
MPPSFEITMGGKRLYGAIRWFYSGEQGNWLTKPSFTFHNISASVGFHKEFEAELNWYANISLLPREPKSFRVFLTDYIILPGLFELGDLALQRTSS